MDGWAVWFSQNAMWAFSEWAEERGLERASILAPLHTQFTYIFHFMSVRFFPSFLQDQSFLRLRFAKRAFATKNAIHTRTRVGLPSHSLHSVGRAVFALQMHFHITHEGRTRTRGEEEGRKEGRKEGGDGKNLCKNRSRTASRMEERGEGSRGGVLSAGRRFANGLPLAEEARGEDDDGGAAAAVAQKELDRGRARADRP